MKKRTALSLLAAILLHLPSLTAQRIVREYFFPGEYAFQDFVVLPDHSLLSIVNQETSGLPAFELWKLDAEGEISWTIEVPSQIALCMHDMPEGYWVGGAGEAELTDRISKLSSYDEAGNLLWSRDYSDGFISAIFQSSNGKRYIGGHLSPIGSSSRSFLYEVDENGEILSTRQFSVGGYNALRHILEDGDDLILVFTAGSSRQTVLKLNPANGLELWRTNVSIGGYYEHIPVPYYGRYFGAAKTATDDVIITGPAGMDSQTNLIHLINSDGTVLDKLSTYKVDQGTLPHDVLTLDDGDYIVAGSYVAPEMPAAAYVERRRPSGEIVWHRRPGPGALVKARLQEDTLYLVGLNKAIGVDEPYRPLFVKMTTDGTIYDQGITVKLLEDVNFNCEVDDQDRPLSGIRGQMAGVAKYTDANGTAVFDLNTGHHELDFDLPGYLAPCVPSEEFAVFPGSGYPEYTHLVQARDCQELRVGITTTELIRCQSNRIYVQYENPSHMPVTGVTIKVAVDEALEILDASLPYSLVNDQLEFSISEMVPFSKKWISVDVLAPCETDLYATKCLTATIEPAYRCDTDYADELAANISLNSNCTDGILSVELQNLGTDTVEVDYQIFSNAHRFEAGSLTLAGNEEQVYSFTPNGNTISFLVDKGNLTAGPAIGSVSIEGCGRQDNGNYSKGFKRMLDHADPSIWRSESCMEVRDNDSGNRLLKLRRGRGFYQTIGNDPNHFQFGLRYQNDLNETIQELALTISPGRLFDPTTFSQIAASHAMDITVNPLGEIVLYGNNLNIDPGEAFHFRFGYNSRYFNDDQGLGLVVVTGLVNQLHRLDFPITYYNILSTEDGLTDTISPYTVVENGFLFGRGYTWDLYGDLVQLNNGNLLFGGTTIEPELLFKMDLTMNSPNNEILWQRSYDFPEGGPFLERILPIAEDTILLLGLVDDAEIPGNFINHAYAFIMAIDATGREIWRKVWKPGFGTGNGGGIVDGAMRPDGAIILGGFKYLGASLRNFVIRIDPLGEILWETDVEFGNGRATVDFILKNSVYNQVMCGGSITGISDPYFGLARISPSGNILDTGRFDYGEPNDGESLIIRDFVITPDQKIALVGSGNYYSLTTNVTYPFGRIVYMDLLFNEINSFDILDELDNLTLKSVTLHDSLFYLGGDWFPEPAVPNLDAFVACVNFSGETLWWDSKDLGGDDFGLGLLYDTDGRAFQGIQSQASDQLLNVQMGYWMALNPLLTNTAEAETIAPALYQIFPNPASNQLRITGDRPVDAVMLYTMTGKRISLSPGPGNGYDVSQLPNGTYLLMIRDDWGQRHYQNFVKVTSRQ